MKTKFSFEKRNVVILLKSFVLGGAEKQALYLANYLEKEKGCNVYIYSIIPRNTELFFSEVERYGLKNICLVDNPLSASNRYKYLTRRLKILKFGLMLRKHKPDIIIPYLNPPSIIAALCRRISGAKYTFWHHRGPDYFRNDRLEYVASQKIPFFVANSEGGRKEHISKFHREERLFHFLPNFSTISELNEKRTIIELNDKLVGKTVIGMVAHFRLEKQQHLLVEAFGELSLKHKTLHLVLAGDVYEATKEASNLGLVKNMIKKYGLEDKVSIVHDQQAANLLPYFDIGVLVSESEGMPNTVMEYMAYSLPAVVTDHDGCVSLLGEDYAYFVKKDSAEDLKNKLNLLLNSNKKEVLGNNNHERLNSLYGIENYIVKLTKLINEHG